MKIKICLGISLVVMIMSFLSQEVCAEEKTPKSSSSDEAIIILSTNTIDEMQYARKLIEKKGGRIKNVFPPSVFIGTISRYILASLKESGFIITEISYEKVDPSSYQDYESSTQDAINLWNKRFEEISEVKAKGVSSEPLPEREIKEPFKDDLIIPQDLPKTKEEKIKIEREYQSRWRLRKQEWQRKEQEKKQKWLKRKGGNGLKALDISSSSGLEFGRAYGAGYDGTSLYMAGDIAVGVFFAKGNAGDWTATYINEVFTSICNGLNQFIEDEPNAHITFTYIKEVDESGAPHSLPTNDRDYVNDLRNIYNTHWAYMIIVANGDGQGSAVLFGPWTVLYRYDLRNGFVVRHETMHIFGVADQHSQGRNSPIDRWGYLNVVNANSEINDGKGYFGRGEALDDIMIDGYGIMNPIGVYSRGQVGWRDSDGDGILESLDTFPDTVNLIKRGANPFTYTGMASDKPLLNEYNGSKYGNVTLNTITKVEYRINGGAWREATPQDGAFDSAEENFSFTTPSLSNGRYIIEVRATNSVGNVEVSYAKDEFLVSINNNSTNNVRPSASFSIIPLKGSISTNFIFDASSSSDIEDNLSLLEVRWDFENDGIWDTGFSENKVTSFRYSNPGTKTIKLEVKDKTGLTDEVSKEVEVAEFNLPPTAFFTALPENQHGDDSSTFEVEFNASGSYDGEDETRDLKFRWDFENDGIWDTEYSNTSTIKHTYELPTTLFETKIYTSSYAYDVYVLGNYAYVADGNSGLQIIDITNPKTPTFVGACDTPGSARNVYVSGNYAYVADGDSGLQIINITDPRVPTLAGSYNTPDYAKDVYVSGNYAYVADGNSGLQIINITNPHAPTLAGSYNTPYYAEDVYVSENYAYVADGDSGLQIINITDPRVPTLAGSYNTPDYAKDVYVSGNYAYVADGNSGLQIINITNPYAPTLAGSYNTSGWAYGVYVSGNYAYVADYSSGIQIIDITNPQTPTLARRYDTYGSARGIYVSGNYAYVAEPGLLQIVDIGTFVSPTSKHYRAKLEVMDRDSNISSATRDMWVVTYNHPPLIETSVVELEPGLTFVGSYYTGITVDVFTSGNYAYLSASSLGLQIIDITNPKAPTLAGTYDTPGYAWGVYISGNYAYVADADSGLQIIDITNPKAPTLAGSYNTSGWAYGVYVSGNYAYVADGYSGLQIIDITNPKAPTLAGSYNTSGSTEAVYISGNYAYVADGYSGLQIIDITNPKAPTLVGSLVGSYNTLSYAKDVYVSGNYAYVADKSGLKIIDITDPEVPTLVGKYNTPASQAENIYVAGNYAYVADGSLGLQIIDITTPQVPTLIRSYNTPGYARDVYVSGEYTYIADGSSLEIMQYQPTPILKISSSDPDLNTTWDGLLEYRLDIDNDYIWDTDYSVSGDSLIVAAICEVRDRFNATSKVIVHPPITPIITDEGDYTNKSEQLFASWISEDTEFDIIEYQYAIGSIQGGTDVVSWTSVGSNTSVTQTGLSLSDGQTYYFSIKAKDSVGLESAVGYSDGITVDTILPTGIIKINNDAQYTNSSLVTLTLAGTDAGSGMVEGAQMQFSNDNLIWSTSENYASTKSWTLVNTNDGTKTVYVKFKDVAGNWSAVYSDNIFLDTTPPTTTDSGIDGLWHNSAVSVTLSAVDSTSGMDKTYYSTNSSNPTTLYTGPFTISADGIYTIKYYSLDKAGNVESVQTTSQQVKIDKTTPQGKVEINNNNSASTTSTLVSLNLSAQDTLSGMGSGAQMQFSNNGITYSTPEAYNPTKSWTLTSGNGTKTVYVKFKDVAGNWSNPVTDSIILKEKRPYRWGFLVFPWLRR